MWERMGCSGVDPSVLSKSLSGQRLLTSTQLDILCKSLRLSKTEKHKLNENLKKDILDRYDLKYVDEDSGSSQNVALLELGLKSAKDFMKKGQPKYTLGYIDSLVDIIANTKKSCGQRNIERIDTISAELYVEYMDCMYSVVSEKEIFNRSKYPLRVIRGVGEKYKNEKLINSYYSLLASTYYIGKNPGKTIPCVYKHMDVDKIDDFQKMTALRAALISSGQIGRGDLVKHNYQTLIDLSKDWSDSYKVNVYDGVARSLFDTGDYKKANFYLEQLILALSTMDPADAYYITRKIQVFRTEMMFALKMRGLRTKNYMLKRCEELIQLCQIGGYDRIYKYARRYVNEI